MKGENLKEKFDELLKKGLTVEEALEELLSSYKLENLTEADPLFSFLESLMEEYELLRPKLEAFLRRFRESK